MAPLSSKLAIQKVLAKDAGVEAKDVFLTFTAGSVIITARDLCTHYARPQFHAPRPHTRTHTHTHKTAFTHAAIACDR